MISSRIVNLLLIIARYYEDLSCCESHVPRCVAVFIMAFADSTCSVAGLRAFIIRTP